VPSQLLDHAKSKNRFLTGMMQYVQADEPGKQILIAVSHISCLHKLSKNDIEIR